MADNVTSSAGTADGAVFATDDDGTAHHPYVKLEFGADNTQTKVSTSNPLPVVQTGTHTVTGAGGSFPVTDSGGSLTVDAPVATPVFVRLSDGASAISALPVTDNGSTLSIDDGAGSITVDGTVAISGTVTVGSHAVTNAGTFATQVDGAALTALQLIDNPVLVDDAAFTPATSSVMMAGFEADETSTDSVDEGDAGAARMTLDRKVIVTAQGHSGGGLSIFRSIDIDESEEEVKGSAGCLFGLWVSNMATSTRFLKLYDQTAGGVTVGTTTPIITLAIPGNTSDDVSGNFNIGGLGLQFSTGLCIAATTGIADADTGAPAANDCIVNAFYK
jgi:hypothetical protein